MKKILKLILPVLVLVISVVVVKALVAAKPPPEKKEEAQRLVSLYVDEVYSEVVTISVKTQGEVSPKVEIDLIPQVSGRIVAVSEVFAEGAEFGPDTVLVKIDDTDYKLAVIRAQARVADAQVNVERELANAKIKTDEWNRKRNSAKPTDFALNKPQVFGAQAQLLAAKADLREANLNVSRTSIKVPFMGRVRTRNIGIGQFVTAGTSLGKVFSTDTVEIRLPLTDLQLTELDLPMGFMANDDNAPVVEFSAQVGNRQQVWQGRIVRTNAAVDQQTRMVYAIAEVEDPYGRGSDNGTPIAVGMFVSAEIEGVSSQTAMVIPRLGLRKSNKVYLINDDSRLEIRTVEVISTSVDTVFLASGVMPGDRVVTSTIPSAVDGMEVVALSRETQGADPEEYQPEDLLLMESDPEELVLVDSEAEQLAEETTADENGSI